MFIAMRSPSMNFGRPGKRLFQPFKGKCRAAGNFKNGRLPAATEFGSLWHFGSDVERYHNGAVAIGMNQVVGAHRHPGPPDSAAKIFGMNVGMRRADRAGERLKVGSPLRDVAD